jgi:hypothetical protein
MRHLTPEQLVDLAEGTLAAPSTPHLESCEACQAKVEALRRTLSAVAAVDIPEPSPLFWDRLSARVREAVEAEPANGTSKFARWSWRTVPWRVVPLWVGSLAVVVLTVAIMTRGRVSEAPRPASSIAVVSESQAEVAVVPDDPSLALVADLITDLDWDAVVEAGLTTHVGVDDDVVTQLTDGERRELRQLLRMELGRPPA